MITRLLKKIFIYLPVFIKKNFVKGREYVLYKKALTEEKKLYPFLVYRDVVRSKKVKNILVYHISGMFYAGTEKNLQMIASGLADVYDYNVFFMYSRDRFFQTQKDLMSKKVTFIEFSYSKVDTDPPHVISEMNPHFKEIIMKYDIDLIITSSSGHAHYPWNTVYDVPIILINIFGSPSLQKNIVATIFISNEIKKYSERFTGNVSTNSYAYLPILVDDNHLIGRREKVRQRLNLTDSAFVFGRIGRAENALYDNIAIDAFSQVVKDNPSVYYLIMSPPPILREKVEREKIHNVIFFTEKEDIWDYYTAIDAVAHFRYDGETFGLNIAEAMYVGKPVISHRSHIWNAHLEYLEPSFSRVVSQGDIASYAKAMREFIAIHKYKKDIWKTMGDQARMVASTRFKKDDYLKNIQNIVQSL